MLSGTFCKNGNKCDIFFLDVIYKSNISTGKGCFVAVFYIGILSPRRHLFTEISVQGASTCVAALYIIQSPKWNLKRYDKQANVLK